ncbi:MAG TPA: hypothetical protein VMU21_12225 [Thermodesulfovibrionales bacterium]|nr:hypothetical protein [Thermodesulfovibrionales bacterium]
MFSKNMQPFTFSPVGFDYLADCSNGQLRGKAIFNAYNPVAKAM